jgi:hypothetical protein
MKMKKNIKKYVLISILFVVILYVLFFRKPTYCIEAEKFEPNIHQRQLYAMWSMYYSDPVKATELHKSLAQNSTVSSLEINMQRLEQLRIESLPLYSNSIPIVDSIHKKGTWRFFNKHWTGRIDTIIQIDINCVLVKIEKENHSAWIVKRIETVKKHTNNFNLLIMPRMEYEIDDANRVFSKFPLQLVFFEGKGSAIWTIHDANLGYDDVDKTKILCDDASLKGLNFLLYYYKNGYIQSEGKFFKMCH